MELQLIEVYAPKNFSYQNGLLEKFSFISYWVSHEEDHDLHIRILVEKEDAEKILNYLEKAAYDENSEFDAMLYSVKAYIPSKYSEKNTPSDDQEQFERASKHELYSIVHTSSKIDVSFSWFTAFAALVAAVGITQNSPALVIGANIIDPSIRPIIGISFASVLGEQKLVRQSIMTAMFGLFIPLAVAASFGFLFPLPLHSNEFISQTNVQIIDLIVAISAGAAGALSFVKRSQGQLVGVMVSLAVLPPTVVLGMMLGAAQWQNAVIPFLLLVININAILLAAILVFWLSGIKPVNWAEIQDANTSRMNSLLFTGIIGVVLIATVILIQF
ncbi:TIGR00341 family protein [Halobacillus amylolyticus]|uniref:TIGR00341 family protein n=1 Tax=Halobacillus amylolyticus TaxID=2932259 RepID=A0ABY4H8X4_9BACI|nr:TIGR00341 family protein [Halobacillus amylolyticus]UOR10395.1 TIGR00341 family protein [Halobacillus amylolyticus]